jgi:hypothetical protein
VERGLQPTADHDHRPHDVDVDLLGDPLAAPGIAGPERQDPAAVAAAAPLVLAEAAQELGQLVDVERGRPVGPVQAAGQRLQREVVAEQGGVGRTRPAPLELPPLRERRPVLGRTAASCSRSGLKAAA